MGVFRDLGRTQGVLRVLISQLTAKFPFGMLSIALMLHIEQTYGDYTSAGIVLACASIGQGISGPITTRLMGALGMRPVLAVTSVISASAMATIALFPLPLLVVGMIAFVMGITTPPITAAARTIYPKMVPGRQLSALFSLDAALQEIIWVIGPVLAVFIAGFISTQAGLITAATFMVGGGAWFITAHEVGKVRIPKARRRLGAVLTRPTVLLSTLISFLFIASFSAVELGIVAIFGHGGFESGIVLAVFALGSLVGGVTIGKREMSSWSLFFRAMIVVVGTALALVSFDMWWLCLVLFFGGFGTAPMLAGLFTMVSSTVKFSETAEAYGWMQTGQLIGAAVGSAIAGVLIDTSGPVGGIAVSVGFLVLTAISSAIAARWIPDLRGKDTSPIPDTEPVILPIDPPDDTR